MAPPQIKRRSMFPGSERILVEGKYLAFGLYERFPEFFWHWFEAQQEDEEDFDKDCYFNKDLDGHTLIDGETGQAFYWDTHDNYVYYSLRLPAKDIVALDLVIEEPEPEGIQLARTFCVTDVTGARWLLEPEDFDRIIGYLSTFEGRPKRRAVERIIEALDDWNGKGRNFELFDNIHCAGGLRAQSLCYALRQEGYLTSRALENKSYKRTAKPLDQFVIFRLYMAMGIDHEYLQYWLNLEI